MAAAPLASLLGSVTKGPRYWWLDINRIVTEWNVSLCRTSDAGVCVCVKGGGDM